MACQNNGSGDGFEIRSHDGSVCGKSASGRRSGGSGRTFAGTRCYAPGATDCATKREPGRLPIFTRNRANRCPPECPTLPDAAPYTRFSVYPTGAANAGGAQRRPRASQGSGGAAGLKRILGRCRTRSGKDPRRQSVLRRLGRRVVATLPRAADCARPCGKPALLERPRKRVPGNWPRPKISGPVSVRLRA
jgi:hypothetical protein